MPSLAAMTSICDSKANAVCVAPYPRMAPAVVLLV